jgi:cyclase
MDVKKITKNSRVLSGYEMVIHGGRTATGVDALWWAKEAERLGAGEICLNSIDADGTQNGYEIDLTHLISSHVSIPVIASEAQAPEHLLDVLTRQADAAPIASMVHSAPIPLRNQDVSAGSGVKPGCTGRQEDPGHRTVPERKTGKPVGF